MRDANWIRGRLSWRLWRFWLPSTFRARFERDLVQHHLDRASSRGFGATRMWCALLWDTFATGLAARLDRRRRNLGSQGRAPMSIPWRELQFAARRLRRQPAFAVGVITTLALAIGANLTMLSILDRLLLRPPSGVDDPALIRRLYVHGVAPFDPEPHYSSQLSYPDYQAIAGVAAFDGIAAHATQEMTLGTGAAAQRVRAQLATASYFPLLGVRFGDRSCVHAAGRSDRCTGSRRRVERRTLA